MRKGAQVASAVALAVLVLGSFWYERCQPIVACLALLAFTVLLRATPCLVRRRPLAAALGIDILLVFVYLWSLDEHVHVVIQGAPTHLIASVGGRAAVLGLPARAGQVGLRAGPAQGYTFGSPGDTSSRDSGQPLQQFFDFVRFAAPRPAWTNTLISVNGSPPRTVPWDGRLDAPPGSWSVNRRGELEGAPGAVTRLDARAGNVFMLQADLMRPDGNQAMLIGLNSGGAGYLFEVHSTVDSTWGRWEGWNGHRVVAVGPRTGAWFDAVASIQHSVRLVLGSVIGAALLVLLALVSYAILTWLASMYRGRSIPWPEWRIPVRALDAIAVLSALAATIAAALIADKLLERVPHIVDSVSYYFQAENFASGRLWRPEPLHHAFFPVAYTVYHSDRWFGFFPPGWPLVLAAGVAMGIPWLVNPVLTGINVVLIYLIGREAYDRRIGLGAALLAACSPYLLALGAEYMSHTSEVTFLLLATWCFLLWRRRVLQSIASPVRQWLLLVPAGFFLGMAFITRNLDPIAYALPFAALLPRRSPRLLLTALLWLAVGAAVPLVFYLVDNWELTGSALLNPNLLFNPNDHPGFGVPEGKAGNFTPAEGLANLALHFVALLRNLFGWPFYLTLALAIVPFLLLQARRMDVVFGASALTIMLSYVTYYSVGPSYDPRYWAPAAPCLIFLTVRGFQELYRLCERIPIRAPLSKAAALTFPGALALFLLAGEVFVFLPAQLPSYRDYYSTSARFIRPLQRAYPHRALVFVGLPAIENYSVAYWNVNGVYLAVLMNRPTLGGNVIFAENLGPADVELVREFPGRQYYVFDGRRLRRLVLK